MSDRIQFETKNTDRDVEVTATIVLKESVLREAERTSGLGALLSQEFKSRVSYMDVYEALEAAGI